jgi:hypothetical protein
LTYHYFKIINYSGKVFFVSDEIASRSQIKLNENNNARDAMKQKEEGNILVVSEVDYISNWKSI